MIKQFRLNFENVKIRKTKILELRSTGLFLKSKSGIIGIYKTVEIFS